MLFELIARYAARPARRHDSLTKYYGTSSEAIPVFKERDGPSPPPPSPHAWKRVLRVSSPAATGSGGFLRNLKVEG
jgi:hypothetical protein